MVNIVFFFGAGASAPFGIPTMQEMVRMFEEKLDGIAKGDERRLYQSIRDFLDSNLGRPVDLESVFTIVDSIVEWSPEKMGLAALYHISKSSKTQSAPVTSGGNEAGIAPPDESEVKVADALRSDFEAFIQDVCQINSGQKERIETVYRDFFARVGSVVGGAPTGRDGKYVMNNWPLFTTNYDAVLESYWIDTVKIGLNTGFGYHAPAKMLRYDPELLHREDTLRLYKLHGSVTWFQHDYWGLTEQESAPSGMTTSYARSFSGRLMIYPIEEKALHVEPFQTLYLRLNRELDMGKVWLVLGYSFGDRIIRDIFFANSRKDTQLVLVHPHARDIVPKLKGFKGKVTTLETRFGDSNFTSVDVAIGEACRYS
jgi:hypothetical protein